MNYYLINIINNKYLFYILIYNLRPIKLKILEIYIIINLISRFIKLFKLLANILILFIKIKLKIFVFMLIIQFLII